MYLWIFPRNQSTAREEAVAGTTIADCACIVRDTRTGRCRCTDINGVVVGSTRLTCVWDIYCRAESGTWPSFWLYFWPEVWRR